MKKIALSMMALALTAAVGGCHCCPCKEHDGEKAAKACPTGCTKPCCAKK